jgi:hypothetical protein
MREAWYGMDKVPAFGNARIQASLTGGGDIGSLQKQVQHQEDKGKRLRKGPRTLDIRKISGAKRTPRTKELKNKKEA